MSQREPLPDTLPAPTESGRPPLPCVGDVVEGKYKIERVLGSGGMGIVVEARHTLLGELVAIKFLRAGADRKADQAQRFLREAKATLRIKSEHVVRVQDMGITPDGHAFLVMEHLEGQDLATVLHERGPLPVAEAVDYLLQACEGLAEAHAQGVVHRDLKPANLFLVRRADDTALVKLLDFGIAKARSDENTTLTDTHAVFGSPAYMPPEQIRSAKTADARSDVWSLAVVLYELLTQQLPFTGESGAAVLASIVADAPRALRSVRADVPSELAAAILRALEKDPQRRTPNVYELAAALVPFASDPARVTRVERIRRLSNSSPKVAVPRTSVRPAGAQLATRDVRATTAHALTMSGAPPRRSRRLALAGTIAVAAALAAGGAVTIARGPRPPATGSGAPPGATSAPPEVVEVAPSAPAVVVASTPPAAAETGSAANPSWVHEKAPSSRAPSRPRPRGDTAPAAAPAAASAVPRASASVAPPTPDPALVPFPNRR